MKQSLQGLSFAHSKVIARRDCSVLNIMMDARKLFPKGFHDAATHLNAGRKYPAYPCYRQDVLPIKCYFTDFGISSRFDDATDNHRPQGKTVTTCSFLSSTRRSRMTRSSRMPSFLETCTSIVL